MFFLTVIAFAALASHPIQQQPACLTALSHLPSVELRDQVEAAATAVCTTSPQDRRQTITRRASPLQSRLAGTRPIQWRITWSEYWQFAGGTFGFRI